MLVSTHVTNRGNGKLPGWHLPAAGNIPSLPIAMYMHMKLAENNTTLLEPLTRGKTLSAYLDKFITDISPAGGDGNSAWLDSTSFVVGLNANEWVHFNP